jgi:hypothetical protein
LASQLPDELTRQERTQRHGGRSRLRFADLAAIGARAPDLRSIVPVEAAQPGDEQVFAARLPGAQSKPVVDLDHLAALSSVQSVVASTEVRARVPLPQIRELLLVGMLPPRLPDPETLANLTGLEVLWATRAQGGPGLAPSRLPAAMKSIGVARHVLIGHAERDPASRLAPLSELQEVVLRDCHPNDSVAPLASLTKLRLLRTDAPGGWTKLAHQQLLENVAAEGPRLTDLGAMSGWRRLSRLWLSGGPLKTLVGLDGLPRLEWLSLGFLELQDLGPLAGLPSLAVLHLRSLTQIRSLDAAASLPALRELRIEGAYEPRYRMRIASLTPLRRANSLERLAMTYTSLEDGDLSPLADIAGLNHVEIPTELAEQAARLRGLRPDLDVVVGGAA